MTTSRRRTHLSALAASALLLTCLVVACGGGGGDAAPAVALDADGCLPGAPAAFQDSAFCRGKVHFNDRQLAGLGGNGRARVGCHVASDSFQLTPETARTRLAAMNSSGVDDPLFRAIDADDFRTHGAAARDFSNRTQLGLVRVTLPLPANVKLLDCGATVPCPASDRPTAETEADVWRATPSILDVKITGPDALTPAWARGPNASGGFQLDASIDTLQNQALSALRTHAGITTDPPAGFLNDLASFQNAMFSSPSVRALADAMAAGVRPPPDPDLVLNILETAGKVVFNRACGQCHGNQDGHPSGSVPLPNIVRYHDIVATCPRPVDTATPLRFSFTPCTPAQMKNVRTYQITNSGVAPSGTACGGPAPQPPCVTRVTTSDAGRLLLTGYPQPGGSGDIQRFDNPGLRGIAGTAPYFHNNSSATLEDMLEHYKQFYKRVETQNAAAPLLTTKPGVTPPLVDRPFTDAETPALLAYLRKL